MTDKHDDPPHGYSVELITSPLSACYGEWIYGADGLGRSRVAKTREEAVLACWCHRTAVILGAIVGDHPDERLQPLCACCGWPKDRGAPAQDEEPPIVRGALDAQADAERRLFDLMRTTSTTGGDAQAGPIGNGSSSPAPTPAVATGRDLLPPGIPDGKGEP